MSLWNKMKAKLVVLVLLLAGLSQSAIGADEVLSVRIGTDGTVNAVVAGVLNGECDPRVILPEAVTSVGTAFSVTSQNTPPPPCAIPIVPPRPYESVATLGVLGPGTYSVSWVQSGFFSSTINFSVPAAPMVIPSVSLLSLIALIVALLVVLPSNYAFKRTAGREFGVF